MQPSEYPPSALQTLPRNTETSVFQDASNVRVAVTPTTWTNRARAAVRNATRPLFVPEQWILWQMRRAKLQSEQLTLPLGNVHAWVGPPGKPALLLLHGLLNQVQHLLPLTKRRLLYHSCTR